MQGLKETDISKTILGAYHDRLLTHIVSDVIIVGAGPSGMMAAFYLAREGLKVTIMEKRLSPGGGIWGGGMAMSQAVVQDDVLPLLEEINVTHQSAGGGLYVTDTIELAAGLCLKAIQSGVALFNLTMVEDVCIQGERVTGVVVNRSMIGESLPVDPIAFSAKAVIDGTGHEAAVVQALRKRGLLQGSVISKQAVEGPMNAASGEAFVVEHVAQVFPGLWVTGMSVCATFGGPRMGPIFGGMLLSGKRVADLVSATLAES